MIQNAIISLAGTGTLFLIQQWIPLWGGGSPKLKENLFFIYSRLCLIVVWLIFIDCEILG